MVIGASEGLGAEWATLLCQNGMNVITVARRANALKAQAAKLSHQYNNCLVQPLVLDLSDSDNVTKVLKDTLRKSTANGNEVGLLVYNAAVFSKGSFLDNNLDSQIATIRVNVESLTRAVHAFGNSIRDIRQNKKDDKTTKSGLIIMSSSLGDRGAAFVSTYAASKAFDTVFAQSIANEFQHVEMDVLGCVAGPIETPNFRRANGDDTADMDFMIQKPSEVASECLHALGQGRYSISTGVIMKIIRFVTNRFVPTRSSVDSMSEGFRKNPNMATE
jgi:Short-chain dehydrogenases of various substrate specificities